MIENIARYRKAIVAAIPAVVLVVGQIAGSDSPLYAKLIAVLTALGVWAVPNKVA